METNCRGSQQIDFAGCTNHFEVVGRVGFEPTTNGLKGRCSTTELPTHHV